MKTWKKILCGLPMLAVASLSNASIVSVSGDVVNIAAPSSVGPGSLESSSSIWAFDEMQGVTLASGLNVDELVGTGAAGVIGTGTTINSYFLHFDPIGTSTDPLDVETAVGSITFSDTVLGLIWSGETCPHCPASPMNLDASDFLGSVSTNYPLGADGLGRGYELEDSYQNGTRDAIALSADGRTVTIDVATLPLRMDQLRVITASPVPLPPAAWLFLTGMLGLLSIRKRK